MADGFMHGAKPMRTTAAVLAAVLCAGAAKLPPVVLPDEAKGTFVQKKTLKDLDVTLRSTGEYEFEKDRFFTFHTLKPVESKFIATPTNYTIVAGGKTTTKSISVDISSLEKIFEVKEIKEFVKEVQVKGTNFPYTVTVEYKNGDGLEIEFSK